MGSFSDYSELKILEHIVGKATFALPTVYVGLSTSDPLDSGAGLAEPSGNAYARVLTTGLWSAASVGHIENAADIVFVMASGNWGTITHFALFDALSGGNMLGHGSLVTPKAIGVDDTAKFAAGDIDITLD